MNEPLSAPPSRWRRLVTVLLAIYWTAMFVGTHIPLPDLGDLPRNSDKGLHWIAYMGLSLLACLWWFMRTGRMRPRDYAGLAALLAVYGAADELLQIPVNRSASMVDFLADVLGIASGMLFFATSRRWLDRRRPPGEGSRFSGHAP